MAASATVVHIALLVRGITAVRDDIDDIDVFPDKWSHLRHGSRPQWFTQRVDHDSPNRGTWSQRYYTDKTRYGGPGSPIFVLLGGEGALSPFPGNMYFLAPFLVGELAVTHGAFVLAIEHRFYGKSMPFGDDLSSYTHAQLGLGNTKQALADFATVIADVQRGLNCTARGTAGHCPVMVAGASYSGFLAAVMRLAYPDIVDMAYASSAPMKFYSQQVAQHKYFEKVTESAEKSVKGCRKAVLSSLEMMEQFFANVTLDEVVKRFNICKPLPYEKEQVADDILFLVEQAFANLNMGNYPPTISTHLNMYCKQFVDATRRGGSAPFDSIADLLTGHVRSSLPSRRFGKSLTRDTNFEDEEETEKCFDLEQQLPTGQKARARCGDWSGCGAGNEGMMWDFQTCTWEVEAIGFDSSTQMFPTRSWSMDWLVAHCKERFGAQPQPNAMNLLWRFDEDSLREQTSRIAFTNGLNDGWSVAGFLNDISPEKGLISINMPNGAHHSEFDTIRGAGDTPDVEAAQEKLASVFGQWIHEVKQVGHKEGRPDTNWHNEGSGVATNGSRKGTTKGAVSQRYHSFWNRKGTTKGAVSQTISRMFGLEKAS